jgi:hypothetical protein
VVVDLDDLPPLLWRSLHRVLQDRIQKRLAPLPPPAIHDVYEQLAAGREFPRPERLRLAVVDDYIAEHILPIQVHDR